MDIAFEWIGRACVASWIAALAWAAIAVRREAREHRAALAAALLAPPLDEVRLQRRRKEDRLVDEF